MADAFALVEFESNPSTPITPTTATAKRNETYGDVFHHRQQEAASSHAHLSHEEVLNAPHQASEAYLRRPAAAALIVQMACVTALTSITTGLITIGIPKIADDLHMPLHLQNWPVLVYRYVLAFPFQMCQLTPGTV